MAIAVTASPASARKCYAEVVTLSITGAAASTDYIAEIGATQVTRQRFTTNGSGAATVLYQAHGNPTVKTVSIRPAAEYDGSTTAAATTTFQVIP